MLTRKRLILCGIFGAIGIVCILILSMMIGYSNCGGNSAALAACHGYTDILLTWQAKHNGKMFSYNKAEIEYKNIINNLPGASMIYPARLLAKTENVAVNAFGTKYIIIVCDTAFDNMPEKYIGKVPMAHAVGYSNGDVGLISPNEYKNIDLAGFVDLHTLQSYNDKQERK